MLVYTHTISYIGNEEFFDSPSQLWAHSNVHERIHKEQRLFNHLIHKQQPWIGFEKTAPVDGVEQNDVY